MDFFTELEIVRDNRGRGQSNSEGGGELHEKKTMEIGKEII